MLMKMEKKNLFPGDDDKVLRYGVPISKIHQYQELCSGRKKKKKKTSKMDNILTVNLLSVKILIGGRDGGNFQRVRMELNRDARLISFRRDNAVGPEPLTTLNTHFGIHAIGVSYGNDLTSLILGFTTDENRTLVVFESEAECEIWYNHFTAHRDAIRTAIGTESGVVSDASESPPDSSAAEGGSGTNSSPSTQDPPAPPPPPPNVQAE